MSFLSEFREFAVKGNVIDLAVGVIIGGAFGKIVTSFVDDLIMPPIGKLTGNVNFADKFFTLDGKTYASMKAAKDAGAAAIYYGNFLTNLFQFAIVAFAVFIMVKAVNQLKRKEAAAPVADPVPSEDVVLLREIRDLLRSR
jgi:large conductance mechanosensitive channel